MSYPYPYISSKCNSETRYKECAADSCNCINWNENGKWSFSSCNSTTCKVTDTRPVYR